MGYGADIKKQDKGTIYPEEEQSPKEKTQVGKDDKQDGGDNGGRYSSARRHHVGCLAHMTLFDFPRPDTR